MNRRKITALLITFAMIAGSIPAQVFAVENDDSGGYQVERIRNIAVRNLDKSITIRIYCGNGVGSLTYCPLTYCYNVLYSLGYSSSLEDVCKALYVYHKESEEYYKLSG